ncbi:hypothetical protein NQ317_010285, partial [Molorchus minor]
YNATVACRYAYLPKKKKVFTISVIPRTGLYYLVYYSITSQFSQGSKGKFLPLRATSSIFFEWEPDYYKTGSRYCAKTLYVFATFDCLAECVSVVLLGFFLCIMISFEQY